MSFFEPLYLPGFQALHSADEMQHATSMKRNASVACNSFQTQGHRFLRDTPCHKYLYIFTKMK